MIADFYPIDSVVDIKALGALYAVDCYGATALLRLIHLARRRLDELCQKVLLRRVCPLNVPKHLIYAFQHLDGLFFIHEFQKILVKNIPRRKYTLRWFHFYHMEEVLAFGLLATLGGVATFNFATDDQIRTILETANASNDMIETVMTARMAKMQEPLDVPGREGLSVREISIGAAAVAAQIKLWDLATVDFPKWLAARDSEKVAKTMHRDSVVTDSATRKSITLDGDATVADMSNSQKTAAYQYETQMPQVSERGQALENSVNKTFENYQTAAREGTTPGAAADPSKVQDQLKMSQNADNATKTVKLNQTQSALKDAASNQKNISLGTKLANSGAESAGAVGAKVGKEAGKEALKAGSAGLKALDVLGYVLMVAFIVMDTLDKHNFNVILRPEDIKYEYEFIRNTLFTAVNKVCIQETTKQLAAAFPDGLLPDGRPVDTIYDSNYILNMCISNSTYYQQPDILAHDENYLLYCNSGLLDGPASGCPDTYFSSFYDYYQQNADKYKSEKTLVSKVVNDELSDTSKTRNGTIESVQKKFAGLGAASVAAMALMFVL